MVDIEDKGEVLVFTGPGKGKTTAAVGVACRVIAQGGRVVFIYFTGPLYPVLGEVKAAAALGGNWRMIGIKSEAIDAAYLNGFSESVDTVKEALAMAHNLWLYECELLVLDDINPHLNRKNIDIPQVIALLDDRPPNTSIILTGQSAPEVIIKRADLVTEFLQIKQPFQLNVGPRKGIDF